MTSAFQAEHLEAVRRAVGRAVLAPSVHNTQPWRFVITPNALQVYADWSRQLRVLDPHGRELLISCGSALLNARVALAGSGYDPTVTRFPDSSRPDLLATLTLTDETADSSPLRELDAVLELRQTNRRRFASDPVPSDVVADLISAADAEGAKLLAISDPDDRLTVVEQSQRADDLENLSPAYRAELRAWTTHDPSRRDGVPSQAVPHVDARSNDEVPIRDFDTHGMGWLPVGTHSGRDQCLLLLGTTEENPPAWLRAGEALERVLLEITRRGFVASPLTQVIEVPVTRARLRIELDLDMHPHVLLRVGRAAKTPASRRRSLTEVLTETLE